MFNNDIGRVESFLRTTGVRFFCWGGVGPAGWLEKKIEYNQTPFHDVLFVIIKIDEKFR